MLVTFKFSSKVKLIGTPFGILKNFICYSVKYGINVIMRALRELPWATARTFFPSLISFDISYSQRGLILLTTSFKHSLLGNNEGSISLYNSLFIG